MILLKGCGHLFEDPVRRIEIIRVEDSHDISRCHADTLVHGIVDTLIFLCYNLHFFSEHLLIFFYNAECIVR